MAASLIASLAATSTALRAPTTIASTAGWASGKRKAAAARYTNVVRDAAIVMSAGGIAGTQASCPRE
jgi:hypothetical protein